MRNVVDAVEFGGEKVGLNSIDDMISCFGVVSELAEQRVIVNAGGCSIACC